MQLNALLKLAFAAAPIHKILTSLHNVTRRSVLQKVHDRPLIRSFTACKHRVSGSLSLPSRGSFHLSLTVLCAIGHHIVFRLGRWSSPLPTGFLVSCGTLVPVSHSTLSLTGLLPPLAKLSNSLQLRSRVHVTDPQPQGACSLVWPLSRSLAATWKIIIYFLFLRVLRCFSSPRALL